MKNNIKIGYSDSEWVNLATKTIMWQASQAIEKRGFCSLVLSGGSTPKPVYQALALEILDWTKWYIFWGDERCVPPTHKDSNFRMARIALLDHIPIPQENIFRMKGELQPEDAAKDYDQVIDKFFFQREKRFDTIMLGLGDDGHTASLFPGTTGLNEEFRWVVANPHPYSDNIRITLTYPAINNSRNIIFLVTGDEKSQIVADVIQNPNQTPNYPAKGITGKENQPEWIINKAAAKYLIKTNQ